MRFLLISLLVMTFVTICGPLVSAADSHQAVIKNDSGGSPYGYVEYLPSAYEVQVSRNFPLVIYLHGIGETGSGNDASALWDKITKSGPHKLIKNGSTYFDDNSVVVCSPQTPDTWSASKINDFVTYCESKYRIDQDRIYITGLSLGGGGTWNYVNAHPERVAACLPICGASSGRATDSFDSVPVWAFHSWNDGVVTRNNSIGWVNFIAGSLRGSGPTDVLAAGYPHIDGDPAKPAATDMTAVFGAGGSWTWSSGMPAARPITSPILTLYESGGHNAWSRTYDNQDVWDWLLSNIRGSSGGAVDAPEISLVEPAPSNRLVASGATVVMSATAVDLDDKELPDSAISWFSNRTGSLGIGTSISTSNLSVGKNRITIIAEDEGGRQGVYTFEIFVYEVAAVVARFDFGAVDLQSGSNYNNFIRPDGGLIPEAVGASGDNTGISARITQAFSGWNNYGVVDDSVFTTAAQRDAFYLDSTASPGYAEITFGTLNPGLNYELVCFGSRTGNNDHVARYSVGETGASLAMSDNSDQVAVLSDLTPAADGTLVLRVATQEGAGRFAFLNALELRSTTVGNRAPRVSITSPAEGLAVEQGVNVNFSGSASDPEDGSLTAALRWTSNLDGSLGTGGTFTLSDLSVGTHTITAEVTDSGGESALATAAVTVTSPGETPTAPSFGGIKVQLSGVVDDEVVSLTIDGSPVSLVDNRYSVTLSVPSGETSVPAVAAYAGGEVVTKEFTLVRQPAGGG